MGRHDERGNHWYSERRLQILVVGDTISGLTLAVFLRNRGFDPLVTGSTTSSVRSAQTTIWAAGRRILSSAGVDQPARNGGVELDRLLTVPESGPDRVDRLTPDFDYPHPAVYSTVDLHGTLREQFGTDRFRELPITSLHVGPDSVDVKFDGGIRESFDLVVKATPEGSLEPTSETDAEAGPATLVQRELAVPIDSDRRRTVIEGWIDDVFVQQLPMPGRPETAMLRMTGRNGTGSVERFVSRWRRKTSASGFEGAAINRNNPITRAPPTDQVIHDPTGNWGDGRLVSVSPAAASFAPATGFDVTAGIEDARVLAEVIDQAERSPESVGDRFATRRRKRLESIRRRSVAAGSTHPYPMATGDPFASITAFRSACLGSFCATDLTDLQDRVH